jgi:hypothetical protein
MGEKGMSDKEAVRRVIERLIRAENMGGSAAWDEADTKILDAAFLGITRASGTEDDRGRYLTKLKDAGKPDSGNKLRWLDIADQTTAPELVEVGALSWWKDSTIEIMGDSAVVRAVVTTRPQQTPDMLDGRYRNLLFLARRGDDWKVVAWQNTPLPKDIWHDARSRAARSGRPTPAATA